MLIEKPVMVASNGQYGPFKDDPKFGTPEARVIRYTDFVCPEGGGVLRATHGQDTNFNGELAAASSGTAKLELYASDKGLKLRLLAFEPATSARKAA
jgi:hypothetical protein